MNLRTSFFIFVLVVSGSWIFLGSTAPAEENSIRAKIGIQVTSDGSIEKAKSRDRLRAGDLLRVYVYPEADSYVYVVHSDLAEATLLNADQHNVQSTLLVLPSLLDFYRVDGKSDREMFTVICSPGALAPMADLVKNGTLPHEQWARIEDALVQQGKIELAQNTEKPFALAGNVRGLDSPAKVSFESSLPIFSGKDVLVKKYEFSIKK